MSTLDLIESLAAEGGRKLADQTAAQEESHQQRQAEEQAKRDVLWAPIVAKVKELIPATLHQYLRWPDHKKPEDYNHNGEMRWHTMLVQLPDASPIEVRWHKSPIGFWMPEPRLQADEDGGVFVTHDLNYQVANWERPDTGDFAIAVHKAVLNGKQLSKLQAEADHENTMPRKIDMRLEQSKDTSQELAAALVNFLGEYGYSLGMPGY